MTKIVIFGGTIEGRKLGEFCSRHEIPALVSVVSEYGQGLLESTGCVKVRQGAMEEAEIKSLLLKENPLLVLDATHPYAQVITDTVKRVCQNLGQTYIRVVREQEEMPRGSQKNKIQGFRIITVSTIEEALEILNTDEKPVLVTTGSKELSRFTNLPGYEKRIYARVLPDSQVVAACEAMGIYRKHIIAMQGPFSQELNEAILRQIGAGWLVTKDSGNPGGFWEKVEGARACDIPLIVIGRPAQEEGISLLQVMEQLLPYGTKGKEKQKLVAVGTGMGGGRQLTKEAFDALKECDGVVGAPRLLEDLRELIQGKPAAAIYMGDSILEWVRSHSEYHTIGILYSGDTGFYSGTNSLYKAIEESEDIGRWELTVYPGISTVSCLCARLHIPWNPLYLGSIHGREEDVVSLVEEHKEVFLLLGGNSPLKRLCQQLIAGGYEDVKIDVGERLGYPEERVFGGTAKSLQEESTDTLIAVVIRHN